MEGRGLFIQTFLVQRFYLLAHLRSGVFAVQKALVDEGAVAYAGGKRRDPVSVPAHEVRDVPLHARCTDAKAGDGVVQFLADCAADDSHGVGIVEEPGIGA